QERRAISLIGCALRELLALFQIFPEFCGASHRIYPAMNIWLRSTQQSSPSQGSGAGTAIFLCRCFASFLFRSLKRSVLPAQKAAAGLLPCSGGRRYQSDFSKSEQA